MRYRHLGVYGNQFGSRRRRNTPKPKSAEPSNAIVVGSGTVAGGVTFGGDARVSLSENEDCPVPGLIDCV